MSQSKLALVSLACGIFITVALTCAAFLIGDKRISGVLLWQVALIVHLLGPGPLLGYDVQGNPRYEGTPIHMLILPVGLFIGVAIYSTVSYFILRAAFKRRVGH